jgi:hypothetical protein
VTNLICKKLPLGSLLALRETCKTTRKWVDVENTSTLTEALKEIQIVLFTLGVDLARFLREVQNLPFSNFSLYIQSVDTYGKRDVIQFMERYGPITRRLSVSSFWQCASDAEWDFYEGLPVLEKLHIEEMVLPLSGATRIPSCIQKLTFLEISYSEEFGAENVTPYCFQLFEAAKELQTFTPCSVGYLDSLMDEEPDDESILGKYLRHFIESWERRRAGLGREGDETLKAIDWYNVGSYFDDWFEHNLPLWLVLIRKILNCPANIMMHRVSSEMLDCVEEQLPLWSQFAERTVSLDPMKWNAKYVEIAMPNLEVLWKLDDEAAGARRDLDPDFSHPEWPKLKEIHTGEVGLDLVK